MISLLRKKHPTTQPNTIAPTKRKQVGSLLHQTLLGVLGLLLVGNFAQADELQWGRSAPTLQLAESATLQFRSSKGLPQNPVASIQRPRESEKPNCLETCSKSPRATSPSVTLDSAVVTVAWEEDASSITTAAHEDRSRPDSPQYVAQLADDPFDDVDADLLPEEDLLPEIDEEEPIDEQPDTEPIAEDDDLFADEPTSDEAEADEPSEEMSDEDFADDLFGSTKEEIAEEINEEKEETPEPKKSADDPFNEPSVNQLPTESIEESFKKELERRMQAPAPTPKPLEKDPLDSINTSDLFKKEVGDDAPAESDSETSKLFGNDPENLDLEIGGPLGSTEFTEAERQEQREQLAKENQLSEQNCEDEFAKTKSDRIGDIDLSLRLNGNPGEDFPYECSVGHSKLSPRLWQQITYNWKASGLCHKPLYFEQVQLERYGHTWGPTFQPIMSGIHFFGTIPILPYKMGIRTPTECVYTLGYYRPGNCAPYVIDAVPFTWRAAIFQGGVATGLPFAIP